MLRHVASYGCVCVAPDLSWLEAYGADERSVVLVNYYAYLGSLNHTLFGKRLDLSRLVMVGHSRGAAGATRAGRIIRDFSHPTSLAFGLIAPEGGGQSGPDLRNLLVLGGTQDIDQGADPVAGYTAGGTPKTLAMIPGANHFGYTDICDEDNACARDLLDRNGTISRADQQAAGAAYLVALLRFYALGDERMRAYLRGERKVEGLETLNIAVQAQGFPYLPPQPDLTPVGIQP